MKKNKEIKNSVDPKSAGFTLIEMIVSVGLFAIVMTIAIGVIVSLLDGNRKAQAISSVVDNLNFAIESMTRDIKTGVHYYCGSADQALNPQTYNPLNSNCNPSVPTTVISFISASGQGITYSYDSVNGRADKTVYDSLGGGVAYPLTGTDVTINKLNFYVYTPAKGAGQPGALMILTGTASTTKTSVSNFSIQTTISQRVLNI
ncbi:MAG: type II secretion system protein [Candidatus Pacebacteria bacterium]|nr:type II secretion system protein [Candidatus Paceibacterota bacterium]